MEPPGRDLDRRDAVRLDWSLSGDGPVRLCLLHPLGTERGFWDPVIPALEAVGALILVDLPGHGRSPVPRLGYTIEDVADAVAGVLAETGPAHVIGASMGGLVGLALAVRHPDLVVGLVLADTTARYSSRMREMWAERAERARTAGSDALLADLLPVWFSPEAVSGGHPAVDSFRRSLAATPGEGYALACEALAGADLVGRASRVSVPTLVVAGEEDVLAEDSRQLAELVAGAKLAWIRGGRHGAPVERPDEFAGLVASFLSA